MRINQILPAASFAILAATTSMICQSAVAQATGQIQVTVTNEGNTDFTLTPLWFGFHNGNFDSFNAGATASTGLEEIAELGSVGTFNAEFAAAPGTPGDIQGVVTAPGGFAGAPVIEPGETGSGSVGIINAANYRYFNFASMLIGTNDLFIGNDNALAYEIFDMNGNFNGTNGVFEIEVFQSSLYDAGTEINDPTADGGAAFLVGATGTEGTPEGGVITLATQADLDTYTGFDTPNGLTLSDTDFDGERIATIRVSVVPEPGSLTALLALGTCGLLRRRR